MSIVNNLSICQRGCSLNIAFDILDEIALEGLDGITINTLFWRISKRDNLYFNIDEGSKNHIWQILLQLQDIDYYLLPTERNDNKIVSIQSSKGKDRINLAVAERELYPISLVTNAEDIGSCLHYKSRKNINVIVRRQSLEEAMLTFGSKLVIVANSSTRLKALCDDQIHSDFSEFFQSSPLDLVYLEVIGRTRCHGLSTAGPGSARSFSNDSRNIFYHVSHLVKKDLIKKVLVSGSYRLYLTRFIDSIEKYFDVDERNDDDLLRQLIAECQKSPNLTLTISEISKLIPSFRKSKKRQLFFRSDTAKKHFLEVEIHSPEPSVEESNDGEPSEKKKVRALKLINDIIDEDENIVEDRSNVDLQLGTSLSNQLYREILKIGVVGISLTQLHETFDVPRKTLSICVKKLEKSGTVSSFPVHVGRQRTTMYKVSAKEMKNEMVLSLKRKLNMEGEAKQFVEQSCEDKQVIKEVKEVLPKLKKENESSRKLLRIGIILRAIKTHRVLLRSQLANKIMAEEKEKGLKDKMDRRTLSRILDQLVIDGLIKLLVKDDTNYFTDLSFNIDELESKSKSPETKPLNMNDLIHLLLLESNIEMDKIKVPYQKDEDKNKGSVTFTNNSPKFLRLSVLHDLMFYLVRGYTGDTFQSQEDLLDQLDYSGQLENTQRSQLPRLFSDHISSYMFIPPLSPTHVKVPGWCTFAEIFMSMPLSVYRELTGTPKNITGIDSYLKHPILRHIPISSLPAKIRSILLSPKSIGKIMVDMKRLCFMGLVRFGGKFEFKKLYLRSLYVNQTASILDTRPSAPGYLEIERNRSYDRIKFNFRNLTDVKNYWRELFTICLETKLGVGRSLSSEFIRVRESEKEAIVGYCSPVTFEEAIKQDDGSIPGDNNGAGGMDTSMFSFLRTNWFKTTPKQKQVAATPMKRMFKIPRKKRSANTVKKIKKKPRDEDDDVIVNERSKLRAQWSKQEDNIVLLCKVAMNFICPAPRTCINIPPSNVRTILLKYGTIASREKTTVNISRRILLIGKSNRASVTAFVKMLQRLPELKSYTEKCPPKDIAEVKTNSPNLPQLKAKLSAVYLELAEWLIAKYIHNGVVLALQDLEIPDTIEEFNNQYELILKQSKPLTEHKIKEDSIRAVLLSSLASATDKTSHASQLFEVYRQYSETTLRTAIRRLHRQRVISFRKRGNEVPRLASTGSPYQFSQRFSYLLNTKYNQSVYHEAYRELNLLLCCPTESHMELDLNRCGPASFVLTGLGLVSLRICVPEQFVVLDTQLVSADVSNKIMNRYEELLNHSDPVSAVKVGKVQKRPLAIDEEEEPEIKKIHLSETESSKPILKRDCNVPNTFGISQNQETRLATSSNSDTPVGFRSARIALYLLREIATREIDPAERTSRKPVDVFVVNTSKVEVAPGPSLSRDYGCSDKSSKEILQSIMGRFSSFQNSSEDLFENLLQSVPSEEGEVIKKLVNFIDEKGSTGITLLKARLFCDNAVNILKRLEDAKVVFRLGITDVRLVCRKYASTWFINSFKITRLAREKMKPSQLSMSDMKNASVIVKKMKDKGLMASNNSNLVNEENKVDRPTPVQVLMRPWLRVDGTVNRRILDRLLGSVLGFIMLNPGALALAATSKFSPALSPVWTLELVKVLEDIGCISRRIVERQKPTLFTTGHVKISERITGFELEDEILIEPKVDAIIRLGKFIGNKSYNKDILTDSTTKDSY